MVWARYEQTKPLESLLTDSQADARAVIEMPRETIIILIRK